LELLADEMFLIQELIPFTTAVATGASFRHALSSFLMAKTEPEEQYTPRGAKIPIPEKGEFRRNLDKLIKADQPAPKTKPDQSHD
jgi:hypothetical protein